MNGLKIAKSNKQGKFNRNCGYYLKDGRKIRKRWWLGTEKIKAESLAYYIEGLWKTQDNGGIWTAQTIKQIKEYKKQLLSKNKFNYNLSEVKTKMTLIKAVELYIKEDIQRRNLRPNSLYTVKSDLKYLCDFLPNINVNKLDISEMINIFKKRPLSRTGKRIKIATCRRHLKNLKALFLWLIDEEYIKLPKKFNRMFKLNQNDFRIVEEDQVNIFQGDIDIWSKNEVRTLIKILPKDIKEAFIICLNCGFTAIDLSSLIVGNIKENHIQRVRSKTGIKGRWLMWKESKKILAKHIKNKKDSKLVFNFPYWTKTKTTSSTLMRKFRYFMKKQKEIRYLPIKTIRKTGATMIKNVTDLETSQRYLCHSLKSMAERHYLATDWDKLDNALKDIEDVIF